MMMNGGLVRFVLYSYGSIFQVNGLERRLPVIWVRYCQGGFLVRLSLFGEWRSYVVSLSLGLELELESFCGECSVP